MTKLCRRLQLAVTKGTFVNSTLIWDFVVETVRYGEWCGRREYLSYQDILVSRRRP